MTNPPTDEMRAAFESWYVTHAFDLERNPLGSRECGLQWSSWQAALSHQGEVVESENERIGAFVRRVEREGASNLHQSMAHAFITHALSGEHDEAG